jgi:hypothetical protein
MFACVPTNKAAEPNSLVLRLDFADRDAMIAEDPKTYYLRDHYVDHPCVLVRLKHIQRDALRDLLRSSWAFMTAKRGSARSR